MPTDPTALLNATPLQQEDSRERSRHLSERTMSGAPHVAGYQMLKRLGEGAYGAVWLARENKTGKQVAIKCYTHRRGLDWSLLSREVEKLALLYTSRNIVRLQDVGWQNDPPYYVMEYLENGSLASLLADGPMPTEEAIRVIKSVCQALVHAHGRGVLHCDLKPANVLMDSDFEPRLCDFGQSRLSTEQNPALGTLFYMAPEQADLTAVPDARWDVYALGALLYHLLVGKPPFRTPENETKLQNAPSLEERLKVYQQIVRESPRPTEHLEVRGVDRRLADIIDRCLLINSERRYANAQAVLDVLYIRDRQRRMRPLVALGGIGPALLLIAMFFVMTNLMSSAVESTEENLRERAIETDVMSANIVARSVDRELQARMAELVAVASDRLLRSAIETSLDRGWSDREQFQQMLDNEKSHIDESRRKQLLELDTSWFFCDAKGFQRWREPLDTAIIDSNFKHRDYFHGQNREYPADNVPPDLGPIRSNHISLPYKSAATNLNVVALTTPVWDAEGKKVLGVLGRTTSLGQLLSQHEVSIRGAQEAHRMIALIDRRNWKLLDHSGLEDPRVLRELTADEFQKLHVDDEMVPRIKSAEEEEKSRRGMTDDEDEQVKILLTDYRDPLSAIHEDLFGGEWLAAFCPVGKTGWTAVVQERTASVLAPVYEMQRELVRYAWFGLSVGGVVVAGLWYFVLRAINERGMRHWSRPKVTDKPASDRTDLASNRTHTDGATK